jgi:hypothetical protein
VLQFLTCLLTRIIFLFLLLDRLLSEDPLHDVAPALLALQAQMRAMRWGHAVLLLGC